LLPDEATTETEATLAATATHDVWVPALWLCEMANLLASVYRRRRISADVRLRLAQAVDALRVQVDDAPVAIATLDALSTRHVLTAYDAAYLELAQRRRLPLVTRDRALAAARLDAGVAGEWH
jgi:predicted nucleic acid-binding protein